MSGPAMVACIPIESPKEIVSQRSQPKNNAHTDATPTTLGPITPDELTRHPLVCPGIVSSSRHGQAGPRRLGVN